MKRIFFLHKKNHKRAVPLKKEDKIIWLDPEVYADETSLEYYVQNKEYEYKQLRHSYRIDWTQQWAFRKNGAKKSFAEEVVFENKSLWYPMEYFLHYNVDFLEYDVPISQILLFIDCVESIIQGARKETKSFQVVVENDKSFFNTLVIRLCKKHGIEAVSLNLAEEKINSKTKFIKSMINQASIAKAYIKGRILLRRIIGAVSCKKLKPEKVLILTSDRLSNRENITDYFWGPIAKEMKKLGIGYKLVEYDRPDTLNSLLQVKKRYFPRQKYDAQFIGTYYDKSTMKHMKEISCFLRKKFTELDQNENFKKSFNYQGIRFYDLIRPRLKKIFLVYSYYIADIYAVSKSIVEKEKPVLILVDHEKNYYGRALISEAKEKAIPSLAFEGEMIYEGNTYQTQIPIKEILDPRKPIWRPIPDKKFLWGEYTKQWYVKKNYFPEQKLQIIGAPKYDFLKELGEKDQQEIRTKYQVGKNEKLVTVITTTLPWDQEYLDSVFKSLKNLETQNQLGLKIIVKMHPNDSLSNKKMIEARIKKLGIPAVVIRDENSSQLVYASDLIITYTSTLVYEGILLNKKMVLAEFTTYLSQPYAKEGLIRMCQNPAQVDEEIKAYLVKGKTMDPKLRNAFIKKYLYSDDGKASERAVKEISRLVSKK